jgi:hypothetical protein
MSDHNRTPARIAAYLAACAIAVVVFAKWGSLWAALGLVALTTVVFILS